MDMCRVRVVHDRAAADVALPAEMPLVELIPDLASLVLAPGADDAAGPWKVVHPVRGPLPIDSTLAGAGVVDGTTLLLLDDTAPVAAPSVAEDVAEAVVEAMRIRAAHVGRPLGRWVGGALLGAAAIVLAVHPPLTDAAAGAALAVGVIASASAALLAYALGRGAAGTALAAASIPWWSAAATWLAPDGARPLTVAGIAAGGTAAGCLVALATPGVRRAAAGGFVGAAAVGGELTLLDQEAAHAVRIAAISVVVLVALLALIPRLAVEISGITLMEDGVTTAAAVERRVRAGRALQEWLQGGVLAGLLVPVIVLAVAGSPAATVAVGLLATVLALRARRSPHPGESIPLAVAAAASVAILVVAVAHVHAGDGAAIAAASIAALGLLVVAASEAAERPRPEMHRLFDVLDLAALAALVVAVAAAASVFDSAAHLGG